MTAFGSLGRLKESYIQWALKASWTDFLKQIPSLICIVGIIGIALKFTTLFDRLVYGLCPTKTVKVWILVFFSVLSCGCSATLALVIGLSLGGGLRLCITPSDARNMGS